ncbi:sensor histidine kinase [Micropruina sp.]|uniref:sensor histidine kinase n=1 Tax=Micropruina sp. TaxID=2737536 RepID=UPI0039E649F5
MTAAATAALSRPDLGETGIVGWMRHHPRTMGGIVVLICAAVPSIALMFAGEPINWTAYPVVALAAVALLWRRRYPLGVLSVVTAVASAGILLSPGSGYQSMAPAFALFAVARQSTSRAVLGYLIAVILPALAGLISALASGARFSPSILDPLCLTALAAGFAVRARIERRAALADHIQQRAEQAVLAERARITADMHDIVAHSLTVMVALSGGAQSAWEKQPERARDALAKLNEVGVSALDEMQRILRILRSDDPELDGVLGVSRTNAPDLDELAQTFRSAGLPVTIARYGSTEITDPVAATAVHRIVQEALTNGLRHAQGATQVVVRIDAGPDAIEVAVSDDGHASPRPFVGTGIGLASIREQAAAFGGRSTAGPIEGGGWRTDAHLPIGRGQES